MTRKADHVGLAKSRGYDAGLRRREAPRGGGGAPPLGNDVERAEALTLAEVVAEADVTVRTVRYYIAEGLLPPPVGAGPASSYGRGHLDRLRLIQRLKAAYLPLKEIRRRLAGLEDDEIRAILSVGDDVEVATSLRETSADASLAEARGSLKLIQESREGYRTQPLAFMAPEPPATTRPGDKRAEVGPISRENPGRTEPASVALASSRRIAPGPGDDLVSPPAASDALWRRIPLGEEAELVISDQAYLRHRERVDWLVRWARKVFD